MVAEERMLTNILSGQGAIRYEMDLGRAKAIYWANALRPVYGDIVEDVDFLEVR